MPALRLNPLRYVVEPLVVGLLLEVAGFALAWPAAAAAGGLLVVVLAARIAYDHRGAGRYALPLAGAFWLRRQSTGAMLFYLALILVVGSLRHVAA